MKKCTLGPKHKWTFVKNVTIENRKVAWVQFSLRGRYKCACGETKLDTPNPNDTSNTDLMDVVNALATPKA